MPLPRPTQLCHSFLRDFLREGDTAIDATAGNGHDTLFLARLVGNSGRVLAFDIQPGAIEASRRKIEAAGLSARVAFHHASHARLGQFTPPESAHAVVFNLGYLPGAPHGIITEAAETLRALDAAGTALTPGGLLAAVCYPGHEGGGREAADVEAWFSALPEAGWRIVKFSVPGTLRPAPFLLAAEKP